MVSPERRCVIKLVAADILQFEQEAGVQGAPSKGERISLANKSPVALPRTGMEQGSQSPASSSGFH